MSAAILVFAPASATAGRTPARQQSPETRLLVKLQRLGEVEPAGLVVLERLVDDLLDERVRAK